MSRSILLLSLSLGLSACKGSSGGCETLDDCAPGQLCNAGTCVDICGQDGDCPPCHTCSDGLCVEIACECQADADCTDPPNTCRLPQGRCVDRSCVYDPADAGVICEDGNPCSQNDICNSVAVCVGEQITCDSPPAPVCSGGMLEIYESIGNCSVGAGCEYAAETIACAGDCTSCLDSCCLSRGCPDSDDPTTHCVVEGGCDTATCGCEVELDVPGTACADADPCTLTDACVACSAAEPDCHSGRACRGTPVLCDAPPACHLPTGTCRSSCSTSTGCVDCTDVGCAHVCQYAPVANGELCSAPGGTGVCLAGECLATHCSIGGTVYASGEYNTANGCEFCDPAQSVIGWTAAACTDGAGGSCRESSGACDAAAVGGGCTGQACCVYAPVWDGNGNAPACGVSGSCNELGVCVGCTVPADCDDDNACTTEACTGNECSNTPLDAVVCSVSGTATDGVCVAGVCRLADGQGCQIGADCASSNCESGLCCAAGRDCCADEFDCAGEWACATLGAVCENTCSDDGACKSSGWCDVDTCMAEKPAGDLCTNPNECQSGLCEDGVCCGAGQDCCQVDTECAGSYACDTTARFCRTACSDNDDGHCQTGHHCELGVCAADSSQGEGCDEASDCSSGACESGLCCPPTGDCCRNNSECVGNFVCDPLGSKVCLATCEDDLDCKPAAFCDTNADCVSDLADGSTCARDGQCQSTRCDAAQCCPDGVDCCLDNDGCDSNYRCDTGAGTCYDTCTDENQCKPGLSCFGGFCGTGGPVGTACAGGGECLSGRCDLDAGLCCDPAPAECCNDDDGHCPGLSTCDAASFLCSNGCTDHTECKPTGYCLIDVCAPDRAVGDICDANEECPNDLCEVGTQGDVCCAAGVDCCTVDADCVGGLYGCDGAVRQCYAACTPSMESTYCAAGAWCSVASCVQKKTLGEICGGDNECFSDSCIDGVCCFDDCLGVCRTCNGTTPGNCENVVNGTTGECTTGTCLTGTCEDGACGDLDGQVCGTGPCGDSMCWGASCRNACWEGGPPLSFCCASERYCADSPMDCFEP